MCPYVYYFKTESTGTRRSITNWAITADLNWVGGYTHTPSNTASSLFCSAGYNYGENESYLPYTSIRVGKYGYAPCNNTRSTVICPYFNIRSLYVISMGYESNRRMYFVGSSYRDAAYACWSIRFSIITYDYISCNYSARCSSSTLNNVLLN